MSIDADIAREAAEVAALTVLPCVPIRTPVFHDAELAVMRRLICAARGIDEARYWRLVEMEIRK